jgi:glycosyltransferase involved in cell wall biosynthesis
VRIAQLVPTSRHPALIGLIGDLTVELERRGHAVSWLRDLAGDAPDVDLIHAHLDLVELSQIAARATVPVVATLHERLDHPEVLSVLAELDEVHLVALSDRQRWPLGRARWAGTVRYGVRIGRPAVHPGAGGYLAYFGPLAPHAGLFRALEVARLTGLPLHVADGLPCPPDTDERGSGYHSDPTRTDSVPLEFAGELDEDGRRRFLEGAVALLYPFDVAEPCPLSVVESLAAGTPVVARATASVGELVQHGETGFLCESPTEMALGVLRVGQLERRRCRTAAERRLSLDVMVDAYEAVYRHALGSTPPASLPGRPDRTSLVAGAEQSAERDTPVGPASPLRGFVAPTSPVMIGTSMAGAALLVGGLTGAAPSIAVGVAMTLAAAGLGFVFLRQTRSPLWSVVLLLVGGYIALNRGFAGLHLPLGGLPLYVGELVLLLCLLPTAKRLRNRRLGAPLGLLLAWMAFNLALTIWKLPEYRIDSVRDAAVWYYGVFALVGVAAWPELREAAVRKWFTRFFIFAMVATPIHMLSATAVLPAITGPVLDGELFGERSDAMALQLLGAGALFLTGSQLDRTPWPRRLTPLLAAVALGLMATQQVRAAFVALIGILLLFLFYQLSRPIVMSAAALGVVFGLLWAVDLRVQTVRGEVSASAVIERQLSTLNFVTGAEERDEDPGAAETVRWRLIWWQALVDEALSDPWILVRGRGYGPDLHDSVAGLSTGERNWDQGSEEGRRVRSPHNIAMTLLARSGVVGLALWLAVLAASLGFIMRASLQARVARENDAALFGVWIAAYLIETVVVASLGVVLESPYGAVPFFLTLGIGVAWAAERLDQRSPSRLLIPSAETRRGTEQRALVPSAPAL